MDNNNPIVKKEDLKKYNELSKQYVQTKIDLSVNNTLKIDPDNLIRVDTVNDLPTTANVGDVVLVGSEGTEDHQEYWYTPFNNWEPLGEHTETYTHPTSGVTAGSYKSVTVDDKGHVTSGSNPTTLSEYGITDAAAKSHTHDDRYYTESEINTKLDAKLNVSLKGAASGLAELDSNGKVPSSQLPSYVDDVLEYTTQDNFPAEGETGKIYVDTTTNKTYRWSGTSYTEISASIALGETSSTAYRGDKGKVAYDHSQSTHARTDATKVESSTTNGNIKINETETTVYIHPSGTNPHGTTKSDVGLGNVGNFKAVSTVASQGLTDIEKDNARKNIGAGTSSFSGSYNDLTNKPIIPSVGNGTITIKQDGTSKGTFTMNQSGNTTIELTDTNTWRGIQDNLTSDSTTDSLSAAQGKILKDLVDDKASLSLFAPVAFSVATSAWKTLSTAFIGRGFYAEITANDVTTADYPDVFFDNTSVSAAANLGILAEATDGKIVFYTKSIPTTVLSGVFFIRKGAN